MERGDYRDQNKFLSADLTTAAYPAKLVDENANVFNWLVAMA
jgi:hypothetical protein